MHILNITFLNFILNSNTNVLVLFLVFMINRDSSRLYYKELLEV